ncbi:HeH/LEM domain-containing protein [Lactococcus garvieae]
MPDSKATVADIKAYLDKQGISYPSNATKAELLALV